MTYTIFSGLMYFLNGTLFIEGLTGAILAVLITVAITRNIKDALSLLGFVSWGVFLAGIRVMLPFLGLFTIISILSIANTTQTTDILRSAVEKMPIKKILPSVRAAGRAAERRMEKSAEKVDEARKSTDEYMRLKIAGLQQRMIEARNEGNVEIEAEYGRLIGKLKSEMNK